MKCNLPLCSCAMGAMPQCPDFDGKVNSMGKVNKLRLKEQATPTQEPVAKIRQGRLGFPVLEFIKPFRYATYSTPNAEIPLYTHPLRDMTDAKQRLIRIMGTFYLATGHADTFDELLNSLEVELRDILGYYREAISLKPFRELSEEEIKSIGARCCNWMDFYTEIKKAQEEGDYTVPLYTHPPLRELNTEEKISCVSGKCIWEQKNGEVINILTNKQLIEYADALLKKASTAPTPPESSSENPLT